MSAQFSNPVPSLSGEYGLLKSRLQVACNLIRMFSAITCVLYKIIIIFQRCARQPPFSLKFTLFP